MRNAIKQNIGTLAVCLTLVILGTLNSYQHGRSMADRAHLNGVVAELKHEIDANGERITSLEARFRSMTEPPKLKTPDAEDAPR